MLCSLNLQKQLMITFGALITAILLTITFISFFSSKAIIEELTLQNLDESSSSIHGVLNSSYTLALDQQNISVGIAKHKIAKAIIDPSEAIEVTAIDQTTNASRQIKLPIMKINGESAFQNQALIDAIASQTLGTATVFQKIDEGFLRIATNILKADGTKATGTFIPNSSPVAMALNKKEAFNGRAFVVDQFYLTAYDPIIDASGKVIGAVYTGIKEQKVLRTVIETISTKKLFKNGYFFIADRKGTIIFHPNKELEGKTIAEIDKNHSGLNSEVLAGKEGKLDLHDKDVLTGERSVYFCKTFKTLDWSICAKAFERDYFASINALKRILILLCLIALAVAMVLVYFAGKKISSPVLKISALLANTSDHVQNASKELSLASEMLSDGASEQAASVEETSASLEELSAALSQTQVSNTQNNENAKYVFDQTEKASTSMNHLLEAMDEIRLSNDKIDDLVKIINEIADKTKIMDEIVFQTKLLSFNASVEAERAGEHGRGFAVVAQEVGNLAGLSGKAAKEIEVIVKNSIEEATKITASSRKKTEDGIKYVAETAESLKEIKKSAEQVAISTTQALDATRQQASGMHQISEAIVIIDRQAQQSSSTAQETAVTSSKLSNEVNNLNELIDDLKELVNGVGSKIQC